MTADSPEHDFLHYLTCDLPLGYPLKTPVAKLLSPAQKSMSRRELLHQQSRFLDLARQFLGTHPWIAYLAAIKHDALLVIIPTYAEQLVDVVDISFFSDLQQKCKDLREASRAAIDEPTAQTCDRLVLLQTESAQIEAARKYFAGAIKAGFTAVEPLPPPPPEPLPKRGSLTSLIAIAALWLLGAFVTPPELGGMIIGLTGLAVTVVAGAYIVWTESTRVDPKSADFKAYLIHENYLIQCRKSVGLVLSLPFEARNSALGNLPPCLAALEALPVERTALEAAYITPFFSK